MTPSTTEESAFSPDRAACSERFRHAATLPNRLVPAAGQVPDGAAILVTGGTGFLGGHLLSALLRRTAAPIVCLVRGDPAMARARIMARLATLGGAAEGDRIEVIAGSLSEGRLGLSDDAFGRLAKAVGTIFHLAARLDFRASFEALRTVNVDAILGVLSLAAAGIAKRIVHLSSLSVLEAPMYYGRTVTEATPLPRPERLPLGYAQSKWTAEALLTAARARGFEVVCLRPSWIVGRDRQVTDSGFIPSLIRVLAAVGAAPDNPATLNLVPVEFTAEACALLGLSGAALQAAQTCTLHLGLPDGVSFTDLADAIAATGRPVERVPIRVFLGRLAARLREVRPLELVMFRHILVGSPSRPPIGLPYMEGRTPVFDSAASLRILRAAGLPPPTLDLFGLVRHCLRLASEP